MLRTVKFIIWVVVMFVVALAFTERFAPAQTSATTSTITGVVSDSTGAVVPNAKVELVDLGTSERITTTTGSERGYTFASWRPGKLPCCGHGEGLSPSVVSGLKVEVGKSAQINFGYWK